MNFRNLRSPLIIERSKGDTYEYAGVDLWIYSGALKDDTTLNGEEPTYTLKSTQSLAGVDGGAENYRFEVAELVADYLENYFDGNFASEAVWLSYKTFYKFEGVTTYDTNYTHFVCVNGYDYFDDDTEHEITNKTILQSNTIIYKLDDENLHIPINQYKVTKVDFYNNGELTNTENISNINNTSTVIQYISTDGSTNQSFEDRVIADGGTFAGGNCFENFIQTLVAYPADRIVITDSSGDIHQIDIENIEECKYTPYRVVFINKYGVQQELWFFKKSILESKIERESYNNESHYSRGDRDRHTKIYFNTKVNESLTLNSGFVNEQYNEVFRQLMLSESVWIDYNGKFLPINIAEDELTYKTSVNNKLIDYAIKVDFSFNKINNLR